MDRAYDTEKRGSVGRGFERKIGARRGACVAPLTMRKARLLTKEREERTFKECY